MSPPIRIPNAVATAVLVAVLAPTAAQAAEKAPSDGERARGWTRTLVVGLSARELGLPAGASAARMARAAIERKGTALGLRDARGLRLARRFAHGRLRQLRFQQTVGGVRVVWSQLDVTIADGKVSTIGATVVPVRGGAPAGGRRISRGRALRIARGAVPGREEAARPRAVVYAGDPTTALDARRRAPRRAWVVETIPLSQRGEAVPTPVCIVVDARTGDVIATWEGIADDPRRGARPAAEPQGTAASATFTVANIYDGTGGAQGAPLWARYGIDLVANPDGDPFDGRDWPTAGQISIVGASNGALIAPAHNVLNAARTVCVVRDFCGKGGFPGGGFYRPWQVVVNTPGSRSSTHPTKLIVSLSENDAMPPTSFNDVAAHELGHVMDFVYAGDRDLSAGVLVESVAEALADMFAYDYDRGDATAFEESGRPLRNWANPAALSECDRISCFPYPAHMRDFDSTPTSPHFNSTILSHAYYRFVQRVGHHVAGDVLQYIPYYLSPRPSYQEVRNGFVARAAQLYPADGADPGTGSDVAQAAGAAFGQVGLTGTTPGSICIPCLGNR